MCQEIFGEGSGSFELLQGKNVKTEAIKTSIQQGKIHSIYNSYGKAEVLVTFAAKERAS